MEFLNGAVLKEMITASANRLDSNKKSIDALNVFPVPDGDTGTNMSLTILSAVKEINKVHGDALPTVASAIATGSLMGARGNSGVILSQIFRGITKSIGDKSQINAKEFAHALQDGAKTAYQAVMRPVEGTILTVAREAAQGAILAAQNADDIEQVIMGALDHARISLEKTPELLPVLKHAGVVDAGGKGYIYILEGFLSVLQGEIPIVEFHSDLLVPIDESISSDKNKKLIYPYCTELLIYRNGEPLSEIRIRQVLEPWGDSMLVVGTGELIKIHIHTNDPGAVLSFCGTCGELRDIKIDNMNYQHRSTVMTEELSQFYHEDEEAGVEMNLPVAPLKPYGLVAVAAGEGLAETFRSLGVDTVVTGGQTMNPSTEDLAKAATAIRAETIYIFPNNSNIILAAQQVKEVSDQAVYVIPTRSVPEGIAAVLAFNADLDVTTNTNRMQDATGQVKTGEITYAVRDSKFGEMEVHEGDILGILDRDIKVTGHRVPEVVMKVLDFMVVDGDSLITLYYGDAVDESEAETLHQGIQERYPQLDVEMYSGGQPLYYYLISVE